MDRRLVKIGVGFALQTAIAHDCKIATLSDLYSGLSLENIRQTHDQLIASPTHHEREIAIWLTTALEPSPSTIDPTRLATEMREMEFILYTLMNKIGEAKPVMNDWMNYIANAAESLTDDFWIDARILLSQALDISQSAQIEHLKAHPALQYELDVLQKATAAYFLEMGKYPLKLTIPEDRLETVLKLQQVMLNLLTARHREKREKHERIVEDAIRRLETVIRFLMNKDKTLDDVLREARLALQYLDEKVKEITDNERQRLICECRKQLGQIIGTNVPQ